MSDTEVGRARGRVNVLNLYRLRSQPFAAVAMARPTAASVALR